ncbi:dioxygenase [Neisseriaceae bacterium ESL0693]|nr:dioxygenase [Neisseriaceae bacterium ESL0693]
MMQAVTHFFETEPVSECDALLDFWLNECSLDQAPEAATVQHWQEIFTTRQGKFIRLANLCGQWLDENS